MPDVTAHTQHQLTSLRCGIGRREFLQASSRAALGAALLGSGASAVLASCGSTNMASVASGDQLFRAGRFSEADREYEEVLTRDPKNVHALIQRGYIALLSNRLGQARGLLQQSLALEPDDVQAKQLLALAVYRADDFDEAARLGWQAPLLASFRGRVPYDIQGPDVGRIPLLLTSPLLLVDLAVNGLKPVPFVIDTGATTIGLDPDLAMRAGVPLLANPLPAGAQAIGAGGRPVALGQLARVDTVAIGDFEIHNIPGSTFPSLFASTGVTAPDGRPVQGDIGTVFLSHFLSTLDYPGATLILRRKTTTLLRQFERNARAASAVEMPFWIDGDHFIDTMGQVNGHGPILLNIDTGGHADYGSMALLPTDAVIRDAGIRVDTNRAIRFNGSGGEITAYPIQLDAVALGGMVRHNLPGAAGVWSSVQRGAPGAVAPVTGGSVSSAFLSPFALTIDTVGMRLFITRGRTTF
jgi:predicted aspartyl protease